MVVNQLLHQTRRSRSTNGVRLATLIVAVAILAARATAQTTPATRIELPNGLRVWVQEDHTRPVALVQVAYKVGAINETPGTTGTAHYVEHMVYRATEHIKNEDVYGYSDRIGGRFTGGTSSDNTTYGETVPRWALEDALRVTAERMGRALFDSLEFERERNNVVTEANGFSRTDPVTAFHDAVMLTSFELHPYRYSDDTWSQDNLWITRNDAYDFWKRYYGPNNAVLTIVGDVDTENVRRLVTKHFAPLARAPFSGEVRVVEPPQRAEKRVTLHAPVDETLIDIVWRAPHAAHADYPVLAVLDRVLAPRLQAAVTAAGGKDLTTSHQATPYPFVYRIQAAAAPGADVQRIITAIQVEIDRLRTDSVSAELARARVEPAGGGRGGRARGGGGGRRRRHSAASNKPHGDRGPTDGARGVFLGSWVGSARTSSSGATQRERVGHQRVCGSLAAHVTTNRWCARPRSRRFPTALVQRPRDRWRATRDSTAHDAARKTNTTDACARASHSRRSRHSRSTYRAGCCRTMSSCARRTRADRAQRFELRVRFGANPDPEGKEGLAFLVARLIAGDSALVARGARSVTTSLANDGWFDIRFTVQPADIEQVANVAARALQVTSFSPARVDEEKVLTPNAGGGRGGRGGGGRGAGVAADARVRVLRAVAPGWRLADPSAEAMARLTAADVNAFVGRRINGGAVTVSVAAPRDVKESIDVLANAFGPLANGARVADRATPPAASTASPDEERVSVASETQVTLLAGLPGTSRNDPDARALELLNYIVGVPSYGGRLGWALTKAGLTYSSSATTALGASTGHITFSTKCDTRNVAATVQAIREVVAGIQERGVESWEVDEAKAFTLGRMLLTGTREDSGEDAIATALLDSEVQGVELLDLPAWSRAYLSVTLAQVNAAAKKYYRPDALKVVTIGAVPPSGGTSAFAPGTFRKLFQP